MHTDVQGASGRGGNVNFDEWQQGMRIEAVEVLEILERGPRDARELLIFKREKLNELLEALEILKEVLVRDLEDTAS